VSQVIKVAFIDGNEWKLPFNFALGLHIVLILGAIYMPDYLRKKPLYPEIYTIDLVNFQIPEPPRVQETFQPPQTKIKKAVSVSPPKKQIDKIEPLKPVSIKPLKKKKIVKNAKIDESEKKRLEQIRKKRLADAIEAERLAKEAAELAASQAVQQLKNMLRESNIQTQQNKPNQRQQQSTNRTRSVNNVLENQYYASIISKLEPHWKLPQTKTWEPGLVATIIIRINKNGNVTKYFFEQKSGDRLFDQFVLRAIKDGAPLPPIPKALNKNSQEIGLRFKPGSIQ